jgi:hypothetical protein
MESSPVRVFEQPRVLCSLQFKKCGFPKEYWSTKCICETCTSSGCRVELITRVVRLSKPCRIVLGGWAFGMPILADVTKALDVQLNIFIHWRVLLHSCGTAEHCWLTRHLYKVDRLSLNIFFNICRLNYEYKKIDFFFASICVQELRGLTRLAEQCSLNAV